MWDKQLWVKHAAVQVDARAGGGAATGTLLRVKGRESQVEIVIERADLIVGNPKLPQAFPGERLKAIVPGERELLGMVRGIGRDRLGRREIRPVWRPSTTAPS
jgi:hypothetical protein